jgi:hypothetical protein
MKDVGVLDEEWSRVVVFHPKLRSTIIPGHLRRQMKPEIGKGERFYSGKGKKMLEGERLGSITMDIIVYV